MVKVGNPQKGGGKYAGLRLITQVPNGGVVTVFHQLDRFIEDLVTGIVFTRPPRQQPSQPYLCDDRVSMPRPKVIAKQFVRAAQIQFGRRVGLH